MTKIAFIFPGQGSQIVGMGKDLYDEYTVARDIFDKSNTILGVDIKNICFGGPEEILKQTINTQPAIVTTSVAILEVLKSLCDIKPSYLAGHSLGEYSAMYAGGVLTLEDTLLLIQKRACLMSNVATGMMAAVINASNEDIKDVLEEVSKTKYIDIANYNSPSQVVLTGDKDAIEEAGELFKNKGVKRYIQLAVSGAFHSKYMKDAGILFEEYLKDFTISDAEIPVITNVDAKITVNSEDFKQKMPRQICSSVYWTQTIQNMISHGVDTFVEIGPGRVLAGLNKKISDNIVTYNISNKETLDEFIKNIRG